ncbi:hypothetical protein EZV61_18495 [Corallincola luteus]|uniref:Haem-binding uptake Tiki superfamily ChaN domain-containing protein n=1 Tax=Corallincola luteus TaxID=1775177 RepID=A0ABY2AG57_9GAMM|nr:ChaN family lipoprotein [Corallincola luteus]TCI01268.1 hypothetical protein EZV61_18495 [Corallincola luteus]
MNKPPLSNDIVFSAPNKNLYRMMVRPSTKIVIIAEAGHWNRAHSHEVIKAIQQLKKLGFNQLGMEEFPSDLNEKLAAYSKSGAHATELYAHLEEYFYSNKGYYVDLMKAAQSMGITIVGLDMPYKHFIDNSNPGKEEHLNRNKHMTAIIQKYTLSSGKIIAFMNHYHAITDPFLGYGVKNLLSQVGAHSIVIDLAGGINCTSRIQCDNEASEDSEHSWVFQKQLHQKRFFFKSSGGVNGADFILHLPQVPMPSTNVTN